MKQQDASENYNEPRRDRRLACPAEPSSAALWTFLPRNTASLKFLCGAGAPARIFAAT